MRAGWEFRVLGPVEVRSQGGRLNLGGPKPRTLLAALLLARGEVVSIARLIDAVWGDEVPARATALVHTYVSSLRSSIGGDTIVRHRPGYAWRAGSGWLDLTEFTDLIAAARRARAAGRPADAAGAYSRALGLWRGPALDGLPGRYAADAAQNLEELRLEAMGDRIDAELAAGRAASLVAELAQQVAASPLRERPRAQLMLALHLSGRVAEALSAFRAGRELLISELGVEPGPVLRTAHQQILRGTPAVADATVTDRYERLPDDVRDVLRGLCVVQAPTFTGWLVAALGGDQDRLRETGMIEPVLVGTYRLSATLERFLRPRVRPEERQAHISTCATRALAALRSLPRPGYGLTIPYPGVRAPADPPPTVPWSGTEMVAIVERVAETGTADQCVALANFLLPWFAAANRFDEWRRTHEAALRRARRSGDGYAKAVAYYGLGRLSYEQDRFAEAADHLHTAGRLLQAGGDPHANAIVRAAAGAVLLEQGRFAECLRPLRSALHPLRQAGDQLSLGYTRLCLGRADLECGRFAPARHAFEQALTAYRAGASRCGEAHVLRAMGLVHRAEGDLRPALEFSRRALAVFEAEGDRLGAAYAAQALAKAELRGGDAAQAAARLRQVLWTCRELRDGFGEALTLRTLGEAALAQGQRQEAVEHLTEAGHRWRALGLPLWRARTLRDLAEALDGQEAQRVRAEAGRLFRHFGSREAAEPAFQLL